MARRRRRGAGDARAAPAAAVLLFAAAVAAGSGSVLLPPLRPAGNSSSISAGRRALLQTTGGTCPELRRLFVNDGGTQRDSLADASGRVSVFFEAWCDQRPLGGLSLAPCGPHAHFRLLDDGLGVGRAETQITISPPPGRVMTLLLLDMSNSIRQANALSSLKNAVRAYVSKVVSSTRATGPHDIAIWAFDGRDTPQLVLDWTDGAGDATLLPIYAALDALQCGRIPALGGTEFCADPSTNLHGALISAAEKLRTRSETMQTTNPAYMDRYLLFFTDGSDQADRVVGGADAVAQRLQQLGLVVYGIGIQGLRTDGTTGVEESYMRALAGSFPSDVFISEQGFSGLVPLFDNAANAAVTYSSRYYRIDYCSPRRAGIHTVGVYGVVGQRTGVPLTWTYNAGTFSEPGQCFIDAAAAAPCSSSRAVLAPHGCAGCSSYDCDKLQCECADGAACGSSGQCIGWTSPGDDIANTPTPAGVAHCASAPPPGPQQFLGPITQSANSELSLHFDAACSDGTPIGGLSFSSCGGLSTFSVRERTVQATNFTPLSQGESRARIVCVPSKCEILSVILIDTSASIRQCHGMGALRAAVAGYIEGIISKSSSTHLHTTAVYAFDGRNHIQQVSRWTSDQYTALRAVQEFRCGGDFCQDPASNMAGALVAAESALDTQSRAMIATGGVERVHSYIAIFTDGTDTAARGGNTVRTPAGGLLLPSTTATIASRRTVYSIGVRGEDLEGNRGVAEQILRHIAPGRAFFLDAPVNGAEITAEWRAQGHTIGAAIGESAVSACCASSRHRLTYCSPKRQGLVQVQLHLQLAGGMSTYWQHTFDASAFTCNSGLCQQCGTQHYVARSCAAQPEPDQQLFTCEGNTDPVAVDGFCRCPCGAESSYPSTPGPGPVACDCILAPPPETPPPTPQPSLPVYTPPPPTAAPTCAAGPQPACTHLPQAPQTPAPHFAFPNSRLTVEFDAFCGDGAPIPGLRFSACPELSDFHVFESNERNEFRNVSLGESMPRVVCTPDVVSLVLLDTSGSVRTGNGIASLRSSVVSFLDSVSREIEVQHTVAVYVFDGRPGMQMLSDFTTNITAAKANTTAFQCDGVRYCVDPSTNLNGAVVLAEGELRVKVRELQRAGSLDGAPGVPYQPYLILFTDGTDQAGYMSHQFTLNELTVARRDYRLGVFSVGLVGETTQAAAGVDGTKLRELSVGGDAFLAEDFSQLAERFTAVGRRIGEDVRGASGRRYRVDYCSPKRRGRRTGRISLKYRGMTTWWEFDFDASTFDCRDGACSRCLQRTEFSCQRQPRADQQFFTCDTGERPVVVDGVCRCPCPAGTTYPPVEGATAQPTQMVTPAPPSGATPPPTAHPSAGRTVARLLAAGFMLNRPVPPLVGPVNCSAPELGVLQSAPTAAADGADERVTLRYSGDVSAVTEDTKLCVARSVASALELPAARVSVSAAAGSVIVTVTIQGTMSPTGSPSAATMAPTVSASDDDGIKLWYWLPWTLIGVLILLAIAARLYMTRGAPPAPPQEGGTEPLAPGAGAQPGASVKQSSAYLAPSPEAVSPPDKRSPGPSLPQSTEVRA